MGWDAHASSTMIHATITIILYYTKNKKSQQTRPELVTEKSMIYVYIAIRRM